MSINYLKVGAVVKYNNKPYQIIFSQHSKTARGGAFVRTKLKNLINGQTLEKTFTKSDKIESANTEKSKATYLYSEDDKLFFMDAQTYNQFFVNDSVLGEQKKFLKEGMEVTSLIFDKIPINIELPKKVDLKVIESPPSIKGDSATSPSKIVVIETGAKISTPIFIKKDDIIRINTEKQEYVERV